MSSSNWKKYGGINKLDKMNYLNVNSISTDKLVLREAYIGAFDICGNIAVSENLSVDGITDLSYIYIRNNVDVSKNVVIQGNVLVKGNTIFTSTKSTFTEKLFLGSSNKQYFYGDPSGVGINIEKPNATLDICGNRIEVLNVFSDLSTNRNIIARNIHHKGIVVSVDNSNSTIDFFNDASINPLNMHDGRIQYQKGGSLIIDVSDNTYVASRLSVSNRDASAHVMRETAVIYDICNNTFAYNVYDISSVNTGNALSLIASDNSSNTFLNIVTPNKNGLSIGGGAYPLDASKSMGTIGLYDVSNGYTPTQNIVRGNSLVKYKTTLGINTHAPRIDKYVVDINGPVRLTNGELTNVSSNNFEIKNMVFSRTNKDSGLALGTPYTTNSDYKQQILYTQNGGKSWTKSRIVDNFIQNNRPSNLETEEPINFYSGYVYDQSYSIIGGDLNYIFYSNDGGKKWNNITVAEPAAEDLRYAKLSVIGVYIGERYNPNSDYKRVVVLYNNSAKFRVVDIQLSLLNDNFSSNTAYDISLNTNITNSDGGSDVSFNNMNGYGNYVYMVGSKIMKYDIMIKDFINDASHNLPTTNNPDMEYNYVYAYDNNYVIAVGTNIISYTKNGGFSWTNIYVNTSELAIQSIILQSVYILDSSYAMAVGNEGKIIYTTDGSVTWKTAPNDAINSSGNANTLINSGYNLTGIVMQDINSFVISTLVRQQSSNQEVGKTNIIYSFLPNLMNRVNNYVFDVSGNMGVDGDIRINDGTIMVKDTRESTSIATGALQISGGAGIAKDTYIGGNLVINSSRNADYDNSSARGAVYVKNGGLYVQGNTYVHSNLTVQGMLFTRSGIVSTGTVVYNNDASFSSGTATLRKPLDENGNEILNGVRPIRGSLVIDTNEITGKKGGLYVSGNTYIGGDWLDVDGNIVVNKDLSVGRAFTPNAVNVIGTTPATALNTGTFMVNYGGASIGGNIYVGGNFVLYGTSYVENQSLFNSRVDVSGIVTCNNAADSDNNTTGSLVVKGGVGIVKSVNIGGITKINNVDDSGSTSSGALVVAGGVGIAKNIYVGGNSYTAGNANISGDTNITGNTNVTGNIIISNSNSNSNNPALRVSNGGLYVGGTIPASGMNTGALQIPNGGASINGNLFLGGIISVGGGVVSTGNTSGALVVTGGAGISGNTNIGGNLSVNGVSEFTGNINLDGIAKFNNVAESQDVNGGSLIVAGGAGIAKNINVGGNANIAGITTIGNAAVNTASTGISNGALVVKGGVGINGDTNIGGITKITKDTSSNRFDQGALVVTGGVGIGGNVYIDSSLNVNRGFNLTGNVNLTGFANFNNDTDSQNINGGSLIVAGGAGIAKNINVGGNAKINGVTTIGNGNNPTGTGALLVKGAVAISDATKIDSNLNVTGTSTFANTTTTSTTTTATLNVTGTSTFANTTTTSTTITATLNVTGTSTLANTTTIGNGNNPTGTGALLVKGAVAISGATKIDSSLNVTGISTLANTTIGNANIAGVTRIMGNIASGNTTTGSLVVTGGVGVSGQVNALSFNAASDYRIKENVKRLDESFSVDKLEPISYYNTLTKRNDIGFIADKVQELYPYLVNGEKDSADYQTLNYIGLIGILVREVQELKKTVDELKHGR